MEAEIIQRFLESVGQKADIDLYLKLFRAQQRESFAIITADARIVRTALDPFHFDLRILAGLGLTPAVVLGLFDARDADRQAQRVFDWLTEDQVPARVIPSERDLPDRVRASVRETLLSGSIPLVSLEGAKDATTEARFDLLARLAGSLETRKVVFLTTRTGLEREGAPHISVVNLAADYQALLADGNLPRRHAFLLKQVKGMLEAMPQRTSVAVVNPLHLLRELFTVNGAGTLIRRGSRIESHGGFELIDRPRLRALIESAFSRPLRNDLFERGVGRIYVDENYLGAALLTETPVGTYLSKFAVERQAQGEGIGGDLWSVMVRDYPSFFWRARPENPITPWYAKQCDGLARFPGWHVFWRGLTPSQIEPAVRHALAAPSDFESDAA